MKRLNIQEFLSVGKFRYSYICQKCKNQIMATNQEIVKCNICGVSSKARRCEKSLIIHVSTNEYAGALYIQFTDVAKKFPDVCCQDIFLSDEALIINHILAMENVDCLVNSATKF